MAKNALRSFESQLRRSLDMEPYDSDLERLFDLGKDITEEPEQPKTMAWEFEVTMRDGNGFVKKILAKRVILEIK